VADRQSEIACTDRRRRASVGGKHRPKFARKCRLCRGHCAGRSGGPLSRRIQRLRHRSSRLDASETGSLEVLKRLRKSGSHTPVLILTARDEKESVVTLLNAGADDYLTKPFDLGELLARTKALIRRGKGQPSPVLAIGRSRTEYCEPQCAARRESPSPSPRWNIASSNIWRTVRAPWSRRTELLEHLYDYNWEKFSNVIEVYVPACGENWKEVVRGN
jgi:hypothetical protein